MPEINNACCCGLLRAIPGEYVINRESLLKRTGDGNQAKYSLPEYLECVKDEEIDNLLFDL